MTERLPGWPWSRPLPGRVNWWKMPGSSKHPRNVSKPVGKKAGDGKAGEEVAHSTTPETR